MRCPICGGDFDMRDAMMDSEWRDIISLLPSFGGHQKLVFEYVEKFGVNPLRIKSKKILRLLQEMSRLFRTGEFIYQRRKYSASNTVVIEAMTLTNNKHFIAPIESHNYLKKVMISLAEEAKKEESKKSERRLREKEDRLRISQQSTINNQQSEELTGPEYLKSVGKTSLRKK